MMPLRHRPSRGPKRRFLRSRTWPMPCGMRGVDFRVAELPGSPVRREEIPVAFGADGWDQVQFLGRTNPGEPLRPLAKIASGGELSRLMLAVHGVLREASDGAVRVFDEVDAGIGGRVAETVGRKMKHLSRKGQILCV